MANGFVHIELNTGDIKAAKKFYKGLFDWTLTDMPMGPGMVYTTIDAGKGHTGGGIQPNPNATTWIPYVEVESVKKTAAKAQKRGAKILVDYQEIGAMGAIAVLVDPTGATLGLWEVAKKPAKKASAKKGAAKKGAAKKK